MAEPICPYCGEEPYPVRARDYSGEIADTKRERDEALSMVERREGQIESILAELGSEAEWTSACDLGNHGVHVAAGIVRERDEALAALTALVALQDEEDGYEPGGPLSWPPPGYMGRKVRAWIRARLVVKDPQGKGPTEP